MTSLVPANRSLARSPVELPPTLGCRRPAGPTESPLRVRGSRLEGRARVQVPPGRHRSETHRRGTSGSPQGKAASWHRRPGSAGQTERQHGRGLCGRAAAKRCAATHGCSSAPQAWCAHYERRPDGRSAACRRIRVTRSSTYASQGSSALCLRARVVGGNPDRVTAIDEGNLYLTVLRRTSSGRGRTESRRPCTSCAKVSTAFWNVERHASPPSRKSVSSSSVRRLAPLASLRAPRLAGGARSQGCQAALEQAHRRFANCSCVTS